MIYNKITTGFVIQQFDTEKNAYISQEFIAGVQVDYENKTGEALDLEELGDQGFGPHSEVEPYLPFTMVQPRN